MGSLVKFSAMVLAAMLVIPLFLHAQAAQRPAAATSDLSGMWDPPDDLRDAKRTRVNAYFTPEEPPMLPWAKERYSAVRKGVSATRPDYGREDLDPTLFPYCIPFGLVRSWSYSNPIEIVQSPGKEYVLFADGQVQRIHTDGRKHPDGMPLSYTGHSIGHWEGDTLVAETVNLIDLTWLDGMGHPHSDALRVEQRLRRVDRNTLEVDFLFDDPKTYTKPWGGKKVFKSLPDTPTNTMLDYDRCEIQMREFFLEKALGIKEGP